jgi:copper(I)-binding protein
MRISLIATTVAATALFIAGNAAAQDVTVGSPWVRGTVPGQTATGAFMELTSKADATLVGASSPVASVVEVHEMKIDNGVMKMRPLPRLELPAGKAVALKPGGYHIMLMDLKHPLAKGEHVPLTLKFEGKDKKLVTVNVDAVVRDLTAPAGGDAMQHNH